MWNWLHWPPATFLGALSPPLDWRQEPALTVRAHVPPPAAALVPGSGLDIGRLACGRLSSAGPWLLCKQPTVHLTQGTQGAMPYSGLWNQNVLRGKFGLTKPFAG